MKAMILAAGKGTRVAPFTLKTPKPLLKVMGEPVVESILGFLRRNNIEDVVINTSYMGDKIQDFLGDGTRYNMNLSYSYEGFKSGEKLISKPLGSAGGLREIQKKFATFDGTFIVLCGDAIIDFDLDYALAFHKSNNSIATVMLKEVADHQVSSYGVVELSDKGQIKQFQEKPNVSEAISNKVSTGIYFFEPEIFNHIPENGEFDIGGELLPKLAANGEAIFGCETPMQWIDIGNVFDLWQANLMGLYQEIKHFPTKGKEVKPGVFVGNNVVIDWDSINIQGPVYIASGSIIEKNVIIKGPAIIHDNCIIGAGSHLENLIMDSYVRIHEGSSLQRQWLNNEFTIELKGPKSCHQTTVNETKISDVREQTDLENVMIFRKAGI